MNYYSGDKIRINDKVVADDSEGAVVCVFEDEQFSENYPKGWGNLKEGVLVRTEKWGLVHYLRADEDLILVERAKSK